MFIQMTMTTNLAIHTIEAVSYLRKYLTKFDFRVEKKTTENQRINISEEYIQCLDKV